MFLTSPRKALILFGRPQSGKTTLTEYLFNCLSPESLSYSLTGFITKELREGGERIGFDLVYLKDKTFRLPLARSTNKLSRSEAVKRPKVGKYALFPENLEKFVEILEKEVASQENLLLFIDEIGKMESFSEKFVNFLSQLFEKNLKIVATLGKGEHPLLKAWRSKKEAIYVEVTQENRDFLKERLLFEFLRPGKLIVFEGIDGAGKSTLFKALKQGLSKENIVFSFEPTEGQYGKLLREILKTKRADQETLLELFLKDRAEHVKNLLLPSLKAGKIVILDRYYLSTVAYQGIHFKALFDLLSKNETFSPLPDIVFYLEIPIELALERIKGRNEGVSLFEKEELLNKISENYERILPLFNHIRIKSDRPVEELLQEVFIHLKAFIPQI